MNLAYFVDRNGKHVVRSTLFYAGMIPLCLKIKDWCDEVWPERDWQYADHGIFYFETEAEVGLFMMRWG